MIAKSSMISQYVIEKVRQNEPEIDQEAFMEGISDPEFSQWVVNNLQMALA